MLWNAHADGVYVGNTAEAIPPEMMLQSAVEHLERWGKAIGRSGLIVLEVHAQDPEIGGKYMNESVSMCFDACQTLSKQYLMAPNEWLLCAARAGSFTERADAHQFPNGRPYVRVTLNHFMPRPYYICYGSVGEVDRYMEIEATNWGRANKEMFRPKHVIEKSILENPTGVLSLKDKETNKTVGVIYYQRISSPLATLKVTWAKKERLRHPKGQWIHLLDIIVDQDFSWKMGMGVGEQLRDFTLRLAAVTPGIVGVCGVTRARGWHKQKRLDYDTYCRQGNPPGSADSGLNLHIGAGAKLIEAVYNWRPSDVQNGGNGYLMYYDLNNAGKLEKYPIDIPLLPSAAAQISP